MVGSVGMFYFSGTGNTEVVAGLLEEQFRESGLDVEARRMEDVLQSGARVDVGSHDLIGIGHPVHGFGAPRIVYDFVDTLPPGEGVRAFIFKTAADFIALNNGASVGAIRQLRRKGYDVSYDRIICMPSNWAVGYDDELARQLCDTAVAKARHMCGEILAGKERLPSIGVIAGIFTRLIGMGEALGARCFGKELRVSEACIDCDTCVDNCPTENIHRQDGRIRFGWDCVWCMRCIYACPQQAISPRFSKFCVLKDGYDIHSIIDDPTLNGKYVTQETQGYFRRFLRYVQQAGV